MEARLYEQQGIIVADYTLENDDGDCDCPLELFYIMRGVPQGDYVLDAGGMVVDATALGGQAPPYP